MRVLAPLSRLVLLAAFVACAVSGASAGDRLRQGGQFDGGYAPSGYDGYGFAGEAVGGAYIGAPLTRFPRPNEIVPSAWGYGTYGVPTVTGITQAPAAQPTVYLIDRPARAAARRGGTASRVLSRRPGGRWANEGGEAEPGANAHVVQVSVPR